MDVTCLTIANNKQDMYKIHLVPTWPSIRLGISKQSFDRLNISGYQLFGFRKNPTTSKLASRCIIPVYYNEFVSRLYLVLPCQKKALSSLYFDCQNLNFPGYGIWKEKNVTSHHFGDSNPWSPRVYPFIVTLVLFFVYLCVFLLFHKIDLSNL